ncbi:hypothetical protein CYMTET_47068 [Cymbomonas tetramitiformis]|uniref:Right handed beta helix domain-containing protein n=1 Tax=Cymbomonas tetramitiformis TaxID=36881 RepID=A0AAE0BUV1_9CHLO|nr:hypothetical protein CYMTET_47068 [Cymbomonas tetramitiformis]
MAAIFAVLLALLVHGVESSVRLTSAEAAAERDGFSGSGSLSSGEESAGKAEITVADFVLHHRGIRLHVEVLASGAENVADLPDLRLAIADRLAQGPTRADREWSALGARRHLQGERLNLLEETAGSWQDTLGQQGHHGVGEDPEGRRVGGAGQLVSGRGLKGEEHCDCAGDNTGVSAEVNAEYGKYCAPWDSIESYCLPGGGNFGEAWCDRSWCYVPVECETGALSTKFPDSELYYSYHACPAPPPPDLPAGPCCEEVLNGDETCDGQSRIFGEEAAYPFNTTELCEVFCIENYLGSRYIDFWLNNAGGIGWCNCYADCALTRCVSSLCVGSSGGDVITKQILLPSLPSPPPPLTPPSPPPLPPVVPPAPPAPAARVGACDVDDARGVRITASSPEHAAEHLASALRDAAVLTVCVFVDIALSSPLPTVGRTLEVRGYCSSSEFGLCEVSGARRVSIFSVAGGGSLVLAGLALRYGAATEGPALNLADDSAATLLQCRLEGSQGVSGGAVMVGMRSSLEMVDCAVSGNVAEYSGGGIYAGLESRITVTGGVIEGNAAWVTGGAFSLNRDSEAELVGVALKGNFAEVEGGAIYIEAGNLRFTASSVSDNYANLGVGGGLLCGLACAIHLENSTFARNLAHSGHGGAFYLWTRSALTAVGSVIKENLVHDIWSGGGIACQVESMLHLNGTLVTGNVAPGGSGGGLYIGNKSVVAVEGGSQVIGNTAGVLGGGAFCGGGVNISIRQGSSVCNNSATEGGGIAAVGFGGELTLVLIEDRSAVSLNRADMGGGLSVLHTQVHVRNSNVSGNLAALQEGGGIASRSGNLTVTDGSCVCTNRAASGGGLSLYGAAMVLEGGSEVTGNVAERTGGGILAEGSPLTLRDDCTVNHNAAAEGGGIFQTGSGMSISACTLRGNQADIGGAVFMQNECSSYLDSTLIASNSARSYGGGLYINGGCTLSTRDSVVQDCRAQRDGGGMFVFSESAVHLATTLVAQCNSVLGGGMLVRESGLVVEECAGHYGGGVYGETASVEVRGGSVFQRNRVENEGGALCMQTDSVLRVSNSTVQENTARLYSGGGIVGTDSAVLVTNGASIVGCHAGLFGGGLAVMRGSVLVDSGSLIQGCSALYEGGGVSVTEGLINISDSVVQECTCTSGNAGGIYANLAVVAMVRSSVISGSAAVSGGGLCCNGSIVELLDVVLRNCTTLSLDSRGGGIALKSSAAQVLDTLVGGNSAPDGAGMHVGDGTKAFVSGVVFEENHADWGGAHVQVATGTLSFVAESSTFARGSATQGGIDLEPLDPATTHNLSLARLRFDPNSAFNGPNVHWVTTATDEDAGDASADAGELRVLQPSCANCTFPAGTPLFATEAICFGFMRDGQVVQDLNSSSDEEIMPPLTYVAMDFYGKIVAPAKFTAAVVSLVNATDGSSVAGVTANQYIQEGAPLTGLMVESFSRSSGSALGDSTQLLRLRMRAVHSPTLGHNEGYPKHPGAHGCARPQPSAVQSILSIH